MPRRIDALGECAVAAFDKLVNGIAQTKSSPTSNSQLDRVIIVDRGVDWIAPFMLPQTYSALIDEHYDINDRTLFFQCIVVILFLVVNEAELPGNRFSGYTNRIKKFNMSSANDDLFAKLRDLTVAEAAKSISATVKQVQTEEAVRHWL